MAALAAERASEITDGRGARCSPNMRQGKSLASIDDRQSQQRR
jgi:hypothetical protein